MKKDKILSLYNFCDSCLHIMRERGDDLSVFSTDKIDLSEPSFCAGCGQPLTKSGEFKKDIDLLDSALKNKNLKVVCFTAPSVRVSLGDEFGLAAGSFVEGKMVAALKKLGFYAVFDMNTAADFTILEEANEFLSRLKTGKNLPMFTSCCPGWVNYALKAYPKFRKNISTTKSPQQMFGSLINDIYSREIETPPPDIFVVSIVPCLAKKLELKQDGINSSLGLDVDVAITTREIADYIKKQNIDFTSLNDAAFDSFFGEASGAGAIFGNTGGVMEAVLRSVDKQLPLNKAGRLDFNMVRGLDNIRRANIKFKDRTLHIAVVTGLKNVPTIMKELEEDPGRYDFVEVMACDGGCIGGGGQPSRQDLTRQETLKLRAEGLYLGEKNRKERTAEDNKAVAEIYKKYIGKIGGKRARELLHRKYHV